MSILFSILYITENLTHLNNDVECWISRHRGEVYIEPLGTLTRERTKKYINKNNTEDASFDTQMGTQLFPLFFFRSFFFPFIVSCKTLLKVVVYIAYMPYLMNVTVT